MSILWPAPAKLNLFLHITGRRPDGFHELQTVFQFIDCCDELRFTLRDDGEIRDLEPLPGVPSQANLAVRAARLLKESSGTALGADIQLSKRLPLGGGLGGGSSNAATALVALNELWGLGLPLDTLASLALQLGADVPVFVRGQAAWAEGIGEKLTPLTLHEPWYLIIIPPCQVSTREVFLAPDLTRTTRPITIRDFLAGLGGNDCEALVCQRHPEVAEALHGLRQFCGPETPVKMTGTGACVFASFNDEQTARVVAQRFLEGRSAAWRTLVAKGLNESPLRRRVTSKM